VCPDAGVHLPHRTLRTVQYADDVLLCAKSAPEAQLQLVTITRYLAAFGLHLAPAKCLHLPPTPAATSPLSIAAHPLTQVSELTYLGLPFTHAGYKPRDPSATFKATMALLHTLADTPYAQVIGV
jgi:hypothetical protein